MSTQIDLGPVLSVPKGDWNAETTYEKLNLVRHNSAAWVCNVATSTGVEPTTDSTDWYLLVEDTSGVSSVNGMKGDVVINEVETPDTDDNSTRIATTAWVTDKLDAAAAAYLLLSGGIMTGPITSSDYAMLYPADEFIGMRSNSGYTGGASWVAYGKNHLSRPGQFVFTAHDGTNYSYVQLLPSGNFNINGNHIVRSVDGIAATTDGDVALNALKTTGGTLMGTIVAAVQRPISGGGDREYIEFVGGSSTAASAFLVLKDGILSNGGFDLCAKTPDSDVVKLTGYTSGTLMWNGKNIVRSVNGISADAAGNVTLTTGFPSGTKMLFNQASAPTGWTKQTNANNATIRVVSSTGGGSGGSLDFGTVFSASRTVSLSGNVGATTLTTAQIPSHNHAYTVYAHGDGSNKYTKGNNSTNTGGTLYTNNTGGGSSHTHSLSGTATVALNVKYIDVIVCAKD